MSDKKSCTSLDGITNSLRAAGSKTAMDPEKWNPPYCGDIDLAIHSNGTWTYQGSPILRPALIKLFSTVLYKEENGSTYLKTPYEKVVISVADVAFIAVAMDIEGEGQKQTLLFKTNVDERIPAGSMHPLRFQVNAKTGAIKPYLYIRYGLEALLTRDVTRQLLDLIEDDSSLAIWSGGLCFKIPS